MERNLSLILHSYLSSILPNTSLTISVAELKELFELKDMYNRYYDFEKHILKKVIKNINKYTDLEVKYQKTSNSLVNFTFKNISKNDIFEKTQEIIEREEFEKKRGKVLFKVAKFKNQGHLLNVVEKIETKEELEEFIEEYKIIL